MQRLLLQVEMLLTLFFFYRIAYIEDVGPVVGWPNVLTLGHIFSTVPYSPNTLVNMDVLLSIQWDMGMHGNIMDIPWHFKSPWQEYYEPSPFRLRLAHLANRINPRL